MAGLVQSDGYGYDVAVCGDFVAVSAPFYDNNTGRVLLYDLESDTEYIEEFPGANPGDMCGRSVDMYRSGNVFYLVVGAPGADFLSGEAYVWSITRNTAGAGGYVYAPVSYLVSPERTAGDRFGWNVAIDDGYAIVGAYLDDNVAVDAGAAYVYLIGDAVPTGQRLAGSDSQAGDWFGYSVALDGATAVVGAYHCDSNGADSGAAYVFERSSDGWGVMDGNENQTLLAEHNGATGDLFGRDVSIAGNIILVGAIGGDHGGAYAFFRVGTEWQRQKLTPPTVGASDSMFGLAVSADEECLTVVSPNDRGVPAIVSVFSCSSTVAWANCEVMLAAEGVPALFATDSDSGRIVVSNFGEKAVILEKARVADD